MHYSPQEARDHERPLPPILRPAVGPRNPPPVGRPRRPLDPRRRRPRTRRGSSTRQAHRPRAFLDPGRGRPVPQLLLPQGPAVPLPGPLRPPVGTAPGARQALGHPRRPVPAQRRPPPPLLAGRVSAPPAASLRRRLVAQGLAAAVHDPGGPRLQYLPPDGPLAARVHAHRLRRG